MKKKIFYKVFAATLVCVLLMFVFGIIAVNMNTNNIVNERLKEETELAAALMNEKSDFSFFGQYKDDPDLRITVFDIDGNVLYESDTTAELENHADSEEIINAIAGNPTTVERYSDTFKCDMTYYAVKTTLVGGEEVILRLAVRSSLTSYITALVPLLIVVLAVSLIISFVLSNIFSRSVSQKVTEIGESLKSLTQEKLIQKQKSDFFANASHELKTPITVMQGFAEVLMNKEGMDETSKKQLGRIYKESQRLGSLISDMLMLSKIESGDAPKRVLSEVALEEIAREVLDGLSEKAQSRNITANIVGSAKLTADQTMIFELVENLVSNAIKYNKDGGSVTISITDTDTGVCLQVKDTGIGIEKEHLPRLCERFYRVDKSHSKRIDGTGLGLAIVKHICAISDAELSIESDFGVGTTVTVVFAK